MTLVYRMFVAQPLARPIVGIGKSERARLPLPDSAGSAVVPGRRR